MPNDLPFITAALICQEVLTEGLDPKTGSGMYSLIRLIDQLQIAVDKNDPSEPAVRIKLFLQFRAGDATGDHVVQVRVVNPDGGEAMTGPEHKFTLAQPFSGHNLNVNVILGVPAEGTYWFEVLLDTHVCARQPLTVQFQST